MYHYFGFLHVYLCIQVCWHLITHPSAPMYEQDRRKLLIRLSAGFVHSNRELAASPSRKGLILNASNFYVFSAM